MSKKKTETSQTNQGLASSENEFLEKILGSTDIDSIPDILLDKAEIQKLQKDLMASQERIKTLEEKLEAESISDVEKLELAGLILQMANNASEEENWDAAENNYQKAFQLSQAFVEASDVPQKEALRVYSETCLNFAILYNDLDNWDKAIPLFDLAIEGFQKLVDLGDEEAEIDLAGTELNVAHIYFLQGSELLGQQDCCCCHGQCDALDEDLDEDSETDSDGKSCCHGSHSCSHSEESPSHSCCHHHACSCGHETDDAADASPDLDEKERQVLGLAKIEQALAIFDAQIEKFAEIASRNGTYKNEAFFYQAKSILTKCKILNNIDSSDSEMIVSLLQEAVEILRQLSKTNNAEYENELGEALRMYLDFSEFWAMNEQDILNILDETEDAYRKSYESGNLESLFRLQETLEDKADFLSGNNRKQEAETIYNQILETLGEWTESSNLMFKQEVASIHLKSAQNAEDSQKRIVALDNAIQLFSELEEILNDEDAELDEETIDVLFETMQGGTLAYTMRAMEYLRQNDPDKVASDYAMAKRYYQTLQEMLSEDADEDDELISMFDELQKYLDE